MWRFCNMTGVRIGSKGRVTNRGKGRWSGHLLGHGGFIGKTDVPGVASPFFGAAILGFVGVALIIGGLLIATTCNGADTLFYVGLGVLLIAGAAAISRALPVTAFASPIGLILMAAGLYFLSTGSCSIVPP